MAEVTKGKGRLRAGSAVVIGEAAPSTAPSSPPGAASAHSSAHNATDDGSDAPSPSPLPSPSSLPSPPPTTSPPPSPPTTTSTRTSAVARPRCKRSHTPEPAVPITAPPPPEPPQVASPPVTIRAALSDAAERTADAVLGTVASDGGGAVMGTIASGGGGAVMGTIASGGGGGSCACRTLMRRLAWRCPWESAITSSRTRALASAAKHAASNRPISFDKRTESVCHRPDRTTPSAGGLRWTRSSCVRCTRRRHASVMPLMLAEWLAAVRAADCRSTAVASRVIATERLCRPSTSVACSLASASRPAAASAVARRSRGRGRFGFSVSASPASCIPVRELSSPRSRAAARFA